MLPDDHQPRMAQSHPDERSEPPRSSETTTSIALHSRGRVPAFPNEIFSLILYHSIDPFDLTVYPPCVSIIVPYNPHRRYSPSRPTVRGIPRPLNLKLVNRFFHTGVWIAITHRFSGCLTLSTFRGADERAMYERENFVNRVLCQNSKSEPLIPRVTEIHRKQDPRVLSALDLDVWTGLERVVFSPNWRDRKFELHNNGDGEGDDPRIGQVLVGSRDEEVLAKVQGVVRKYLSGPPNGMMATSEVTQRCLTIFRDRGVKLIFVNRFQINPKRYERCFVDFWVDVTGVSLVVGPGTRKRRGKDTKAGVEGSRIEKRVNCNPECQEDDDLEEEEERKASEMEEHNGDDNEAARRPTA